MIFILILLVYSSTTILICSAEETTEDRADTATLDEYILCRSCGSDISAASFIVPITSPFSRYAFNDTLFKKEQVLIQVLSNGLAFDFPVITLTHSDCLSDGEWEEQESWFPGYRWKICICPDCGEFVGWLFEPIDPAQLSNKPFYGLILSTLIGESCKY